MAIKEIFPNPTVKEVVFQMRFPCLFSIENLIGSYQVRIMERFPKSELVLSKQLFIGTLPSSGRLPTAAEHDLGGIKKIWKFETESGVTMNIQVDSLSISSTLHKTYNNPKGKERFRDIIAFAVDNFIKVTEMPKFNRIGLRYIDHCPVPSKVHVSFKKYYNTTFPLDRFCLKDALEMSFKARVKRANYFLTFRESLIEEANETKLKLDFDGYAMEVKSSDYLSVTDNLHRLISDEYEDSIKEPIYRFMRKKVKPKK